MVLNQALQPKQTNRFYMSDSPLCLGRLRPAKRFTSIHVRSVSALRGNTMQPDLFLQAPMGGGLCIYMAENENAMFF